MWCERKKWGGGDSRHCESTGGPLSMCGRVSRNTQSTMVRCVGAGRKLFSIIWDYLRGSSGIAEGGFDDWDHPDAPTYAQQG